jgi:hypothetical protein
MQYYCASTIISEKDKNNSSFVPAAYIMTRNE